MFIAGGCFNYGNLLLFIDHVRVMGLVDSMNWQQLEGFEDIECAFVDKFCIYVAMVNDQYHIWQMYINDKDMPVVPQQTLTGGVINFRSPVARSYMGLSKSDAYSKAEQWASEIETS